MDNIWIHLVHDALACEGEQAQGGDQQSKGKEMAEPRYLRCCGLRIELIAEIIIGCQLGQTKSLFGRGEMGQGTKWDMLPSSITGVIFRELVTGEQINTKKLSDAQWPSSS